MFIWGKWKVTKPSKQPVRLRAVRRPSLAGGREGTMRWDQSREGFTLKAGEAGIKRMFRRRTG